MLEGADPTAEFSLVDAERRFLVVPMEEETHGGTSDRSEHGEKGEQEVDTLRWKLGALAEENQALKVEVSALGHKLHNEKARFCESCRTNCQCLAEYDEVIAARDAKIEELKRQLHSLSVRSEPHPPVTHETDYHEIRLVEELHTRGEPVPRAHQGKTPPVDPFTGEDPEMHIDEWLPSLEWAHVWNDWTEEELLMQLAGHIRSRALQESELLDVDTKTLYIQAIEALCLRLDPGSRTLAA